jgi:phosphatidylinositol alpha-1,6-mannosyltransferase
VRILLVTNDFPPRPGGIQQYLRGLVNALEAHVRVLAPADPDAAETDGVVRGHRRFMWPTRRTRRWVQSQIEDFRPDVVLFGAPHPLAHLGPGLRHRTGVPYAVLCHGAEVTIPAAFPISRQLLRWPLKRADVLFGVSDFTSARVERLTGRQVIRVGAGVDPAFSPGEGDLPSMIVGCVSRFVPRKGQRRVIEAAARLRQRGVPVSVLLVGKGRDEQALRRLAARLEVPARFEVGVPFDRLPDLYRDMTVFAMPSRSRWFGLEAEGLGVVYLEAAATGLPVIAGDSGGAPETIEPGVTGFIATRTEHVADALERVLADGDGAEAMGAAGRRRVLDRFSWEAVAGRFLGGFEAAVAGGDS